VSLWRGTSILFLRIMKTTHLLFCLVAFFAVSMSWAAWTNQWTDSQSEHSHWAALDEVKVAHNKKAKHHAQSLKSTMMTGTLSCTSDVDQNGIPLEAYLNVGLVTETLTCTIYLDQNGNDVTEWAWPLYCAGENLEDYFPNYTTFTYSPMPYEISGDLIAAPYTVHTYSYPGDPGSVYLWIVDGGSVIGGQGTPNAVIAWGPDGIGFVGVVEVMDGQCPGVLVSDLIVVGAVGVNELTTSAHIGVFPTPADHELRITSDVYQNQCDVVLYDLSGRTVSREQMTGTSHYMHTHALEEGVYVLLVGKSMHKVVVKH